MLAPCLFLLSFFLPLILASPQHSVPPFLKLGMGGEIWNLPFLQDDTVPICLRLYLITRWVQDAFLCASTALLIEINSALAAFKWIAQKFGGGVYCSLWNKRFWCKFKEGFPDATTNYLRIWFPGLAWTLQNGLINFPIHLIDERNWFPRGWNEYLLDF